MGANSFIRVVEKGTSWAIYAISTYDEATTSTTILKLYKKFQNLFEKNNTNILPKHCQYNSAIDL